MQLSLLASDIQEFITASLQVNISKLADFLHYFGVAGCGRVWQGVAGQSR